MDFKNTDERNPSAGFIKLVNDDGEFRLLDANGRRYRLRPESGTPTVAVAATGVLTGTTIAADDTVTIGDETYVFVAALTDPAVPYEVLVGVSDSVSLDNLIAAVNGAAGEGTTYGTGTDAHPSVTAAAGAGDTIDFSAAVVGTGGNTIATTAALTSGDFGAATLTGGTYCTVGSKGDQMIDGSYLYTCTAHTTATSTSGWEKSAVAAV